MTRSSQLKKAADLRLIENTLCFAEGLVDSSSNCD